MKHAIIIAAVLSIAATAQTETSSLRVEEVFSVETSEELEASLTDGYPMPWLAAILEDETIPEEDRYWLDCRVRAVIARDLHTFFDREGNRVDVNAEGGIRNGEAYWREVFIVEPDFVDKKSNIEFPRMFGRESIDTRPEIEPPYYFWRTPGYLVNGFGEKIGEIATTDFGIHLSRNGETGIYTTRFSNPSHAFFLNSNSDVKDVVIGPRLSGSSSISIADDGSIALVACFGKGSSWTENREGGLGVDYPDNEVTLHAFTGDGDLLFTRNLPERPTGSYPPQVSPDSRYIAYTSASSNKVFLFDASTGETIYEWDSYGCCYPYFTQNSRYLCVPAVGGAKIFDCSTGEIGFEMPEGEIPLRDYHRGMSASNDLAVITGERKLRVPLEDVQYFLDTYINGQLYSSELMNSYVVQTVSPNGFFIDSQNYSPFIDGPREGNTIPYSLLQVMGVKR